MDLTSVVVYAALILSGVSTVQGIRLIWARENQELSTKAKQAVDDAIAKLQEGLASKNKDDQEQAINHAEGIAKIVDSITKLLGVKSGPAALLCLVGLAFFAGAIYLLVST